MSLNGKEPAPVTGELPVSLNILSVVNRLSISYLRIKGFFYILQGLTWIVYYSPSREAGLAWINVLKPDIVGIAWVLAGALSLITSFVGSERMKRLGFFALIVLPTILGFYFLISWLAYILPFIVVEGYQRGGITTAVYWAFAASAYLMARIHSASYSNSYGGENRR